MHIVNYPVNDFRKNDYLAFFQSLVISVYSVFVDLIQNLEFIFPPFSLGLSTFLFFHYFKFGVGMVSMISI